VPAIAPKSLTRAQVRELDRRAIEEFGIPGILLMENAGRGAAEVLLRLSGRGPVHIVCGKGNNGGDGYVVARHLDAHRVGVVVHRCCDETEIQGDALAHYRILQRCGVPIHGFESAERLAEHLQFAEWIVDALFGTGLTGAVRFPHADILRTINASGLRVLALDLPSGLDADTGQPLGETIKARHTVTFVAPKLGFNPSAAPYLGEVHIVPIGVPRVLLEEYGL
jgi:NAD(P)H-hydrate epimerase